MTGGHLGLGTDAEVTNVSWIFARGMIRLQAIEVYCEASRWSLGHFSVL